MQLPRSVVVSASSCNLVVSWVHHNVELRSEVFLVLDMMFTLGLATPDQRIASGAVLLVTSEDVTSFIAVTYTRSIARRAKAGSPQQLRRCH